MPTMRSPPGPDRVTRATMKQKQAAAGAGGGTEEGPRRIDPHAGGSGEQPGGAAGAAAAGIAAVQACEQRMEALEQENAQLRALVEACRAQVAAMQEELKLVKDSCDKGGSAALAASTRSERLEVRATALQSELQEVRDEQQRMQNRHGSAEQREAEQSVVVRVPRASSAAWATGRPQGPGGPPPPPGLPVSEGDVRAAATDIAVAATQKAGGGHIHIKQARPLPGPRGAAGGGAAGGGAAGGGAAGGSRSDGDGAGGSILVLVTLRDAATRNGILKGASCLGGDRRYDSVYINPALTGAQRELRYRYLQSAAYKAARAAQKRVVWRGPVPLVRGVDGSLEALPPPPLAEA
jgi:Skp family chaperone for outer membrane proteins